MNNLIESSYITATQLREIDFDPCFAVGVDSDILARFQMSNTFTKISVVGTQDFLGRLSAVRAAYDSDVEALNEVIKWQHRVIDFNSIYVAYLLEQIDDDEFERIASEVAVEERDIDKEVIATKISQILRLTTIDFTPSDLANLLRCSPDSVIDAIDCIQVSDRSHIKSDEEEE